MINPIVSNIRNPVELPIEVKMPKIRQTAEEIPIPK
jgi:hypothetical protein